MQNKEPLPDFHSIAKLRISNCRDSYFQIFSFLSNECDRTPKVKIAIDSLIHSFECFENAKSDMIIDRDLLTEIEFLTEKIKKYESKFEGRP